ncbi:MAG: sigma-70 family RNA polymerase sigma factor [Bacteroidota bacterium]
MADTTGLLLDVRADVPGAVDRLFPVVYDELRQIARARLRDRSAGHTLDTSALVHEVYVRLVDATRVTWKDRSHFFALAARAMRFTLVDYARRRTAEKRGGGAVRVTLKDDLDGLAEERAADLVALDDALAGLAAVDARAAQVVECRFFGGLSVEETAEALETSERTVKRDWQKARLWLVRTMQEGAPS